VGSGTSFDFEPSSQPGYFNLLDDARALTLADDAYFATGEMQVDFFWTDPEGFERTESRRWSRETTQLVARLFPGVRNDYLNALATRLGQ
jgi:hypothetical protein